MAAAAMVTGLPPVIYSDNTAADKRNNATGTCARPMNYESGMTTDSQLLLEGGQRRSSRKWWILSAIAIVLAFALIYSVSHRKDPAMTGRDAAQVPNVSVIVPGRSNVASTVAGNGSLAARREMPVGVAGEGGMVTRVLVEPGSWVGAGQVLATVDRSVQTQTAASLEAQIRVARADAQLAQAELARAESLVDRGFVSKADLQRKQATRDQAAARVRVAEAQLAETRARNGRLDIRSPAAGLVLTRGVEPGQIVGAGSGQLFRVAMGGQMELRTQLAQGDLARVHVGAAATVTPVGSARSFKGEVWQVSPVIDPQTRQGIARIAIAFDRDLRPGGFASATIVAGAVQAPLLPESAVMSDGQGNFVYVVGRDNKVVRRNVTVGEVSDAGAVIAGGLTGTEHVVRSAGAFLNPGQSVKPHLETTK